MIDIFFNYFNLLNFKLILIIGLILYLMKKKSRENELNKALKQQAIDSIERRSEECPQQYPNGWLPVYDSQDLKKRDVKPIFALGHDLVIYRGTSGKVYVFDAYCPHLGANLGVGGSVVGDDIKCHFHGWQFNNQGDCKAIPGLDDKSIPKTIIRKWRCDEVNHFIYVWHHLDQKEPDWFVPKLDQIDSLVYRTKVHLQTYCHIQKIVEDEADLVHLETLHAQENIIPKLLQYLIQVKSSWTTPFKECDPPNTHCTDWGFKMCIKVLGFSELSPIFFNAKQIGPGYAPFNVDLKPLIKTDFLVTFNIITLGSMNQLMVFKVYSEPSIVGYLLTTFIMPSFLNYFLGVDVLTWNRIRYRRNPTFTKTKSDEALLGFRRWYNQFYSDHSKAN